MNININLFVKKLFIFCFIILLTACAKFNEEMNKEASDEFEPKIFVEEKQDTVTETTTLGPKINKSSINKNKIGKLNLGDLQLFIESKRIKSSEKIDIKYLHSSKILKKKYEKIKILGQGEIKDKVNLEVHYLSNSAKEKLSKNGSTIKILESK